MKTLIKGGHIVSLDGIFDILVEDSYIVDISANIDSCCAGNVINAEGSLVFPGFIDPHTHFDMPTSVTVTADNFKTGTYAALMGGTTTVLDFAAQTRGESLTKGLDEWHKKADGSCSCNYSFHMTITEWNKQVAAELPLMTKDGITSYKVYMAYDNMRIPYGDMQEAFKGVSLQGGITGVHCELSDEIDALSGEFFLKDPSSVASHPRSRPACFEADAIKRLSAIAKSSESRVNVVHISSRIGLEAAIEAQNQGTDMYIETCPQYLCLTEDVYFTEGFNGAKYVCSPPIRTQSDVAALWQGIYNENISTIGTDHCSFNMEGQKSIGKSDFRKIPGGIPGVEYRPTLIYTFGVKLGKITLKQMLKTLSENPARLFGMYPRKGAIKKGSDADIVVWNPDYSCTLTDKTHHNCDYNPYAGMKICGRAEHVLVNGIHVVKNAEPIKMNAGKFVKRGASEAL